MKTKFNGILTLLLAFVVQLSFAQERTISGVVSDESGPLPGVSVFKKGTTQGTETDFDGKYSLKAKSGDVIVFSFVGMETVEKTVGTTSNISVAMQSDNLLDEVVVTALGIEVNKNQVASSVSKVKGDALKTTGETSVIQGLAGKASGVQIINSSGDAGASAYIQIRGQSTITRSLQPLIVIDGIPVSNDELGNSTDGVTQQSRLGDINPDDIANVQVLKGASAAAVWGSRAGNGVIVITTKKGRSSGGSFNVSYTASFSFDNALTRMPLQDTFGKGLNGVWSDSAAGSRAGSWGDKISTRSGTDVVNTSSTSYFESDSGKRYYPITNKNDNTSYNDTNYDAVFRMGHVLRNNLSISSGSDTGSFFFSLSDTRQEGIILNNDYRRTTARINSEFKLSNKIKLKGTFAYTNSSSNRVQQGSNLSGLLLGLYRTPADFDIRDYKGTRWVNGTPNRNSQRGYRRQYGTNFKQGAIYNNPLWTTNVQKNPNKVNRYIGGGEVQYTVADWVTLIGRAGVDHYTDNRISMFPIHSGNGESVGNASESFISYLQTNADFIANTNFDLADKLNLNFLAGLNFNQRKLESRGGSYENFIIDSDKFFYQNATKENVSSTIGQSLVRTSAGYFTSTFNYDSMLYLTLTGRAETASTFGQGKIFFYPSAELAYNFKSLFEDSILSKGKLRLTYGQVGQEPAPYAQDTYYVSGSGGEGWGPAYDTGSYDGSFVRSSVEGNKNLKPEVKTEMEAGIDLGFFDNRLNLNFTYYQNETNDALFSVPRAGTTGYSAFYSNAASLENKGFEIDLNADVVKTENFKWNLNANWSTNKNKVTDLKGTKSLFLAGFTGTSSRAVEGQPVGVLWGGRFARDNNNALILDANGFPTVSNVEGIIGDPNPDWRGGLRNTFSYKNFSLSALFDASMGGDAWDGTNGALTTFGKPLVTANEVTVSATDASTIKNYSGTTIDNISYANQNADGSYTVRGNLKDFGNGTVLLDQQWYRSTGGGFGPVSEQFVKDASWVKFRELTLSYLLTHDGLKKAGLQSAEFSLTGRNLWFWSKSDFGQDPESNLTGASNGRGLQYFNHPTTKSYLATLKLNF